MVNEGQVYEKDWHVYKKWEEKNKKERFVRKEINKTITTKYFYTLMNIFLQNTEDL